MSRIMPLTFHFYNLVSVKNFHTGQFSHRCAHVPVNFVFIDHNFCVGSSVKKVYK